MKQCTIFECPRLECEDFDNSLACSLCPGLKEAELTKETNKADENEQTKNI